MIRKNFVLIFFIFFTSCGYEAIFSKKNFDLYNFTISEINFEGDRVVNIRLNQKLMTVKRSDTKSKKIIDNENKYTLDIISNSIKTITAKDSKGDPASYKITVTASLNAKGTNSNIKNSAYNSSFKYDNLTDKIELRNYERQIKFNLAENIANEILSDISNLSGNSETSLNISDLDAN
tara:strand:- start:2026 stop:2559 length:534 start_codon:yes stop_codon:yes gene_type:complete